MAFPGRPAHDFLLFFPVRRRAAFLHGPMPPPPGVGPFLSFRPVIGRGPCRRVVDARIRVVGPWRLVMREAVMSGMVLADDSLINLFPDPAWDVAGFRDLAGGVIAVCLYAAVAMVIVGVLTLLPGLITNNMMERAFSWKRLLCALMIPLTIGAATSGFAWGAGAFGTDGLAVNDSYQSANGHPDWKGVKNDEAKKSDDLGGVVRQLGEDIANRVGKAAGDAIDKALSTGKKAWQWLSGGDGKGNVFQKAGDAASGAWDWLSGGDGKGNVFEKTGQAAGDLWSSLFG